MRSLNKNGYNSHTNQNTKFLRPALNRNSSDCKRPQAVFWCLLFVCFCFLLVISLNFLNLQKWTCSAFIRKSQKILKGGFHNLKMAHQYYNKSWTMQHCTNNQKSLETSVIDIFWFKWSVFWLAIVQNPIRLEQLNANVQLWWG